RLFAVVRRCDPMVDGVIADVVIQDEVGREAAYFGGLRLQRLVPAEARQIQWIPSWKSSKSSGSPAPGRCLVVGATRTVAPVAAALAELDQIAITINWDEEAQGESESDSLPPNSKPSWPTLDHHMTEGGGAIDTVVYVVPTFAHLDPAQRYLRQGRCLVSLSRLALIGLGQVSRLILISDGSPANEFTPALAYGRALYSEFKDLQVVHVSSTDKLTSMSASSLYTLMRTSLATTTTTEYRLHGENLSVRTLEPQADSSTKFSPRAGVTYLITGGLGALGSMLVRELVARGADHVMLCGRSAPDSTAITSLNTEGVRIGYCQADVTDISEVNDMLMEIDRGWPPLAGVFHSAGLTDDAVLTSLDWSRYARVLAPKVQGAWNLHTATKDRALEVFVLFSSMASLIGSAGQANYAMANGFLDALAEHRQRHGLPVLTINWGPWSGDGMAADYGDHFARMGVHLLEPQVAMEQLFHALAQDSPQLLIADVKWPQFLSQRGTRVADQLLASFASQAEPPAQATPLLDVVELAKLPPKDAKGAIFDALFQRTVRILRIPATQQTSFWKRFAHARLNQLGFDSLMALELRNQLIADLGVQVPVRHFVGGSTAVAVVELIFEQAVLKALVSNDGDLSIAGEREEITI
ncbi:MAG TPA: beta-ketoacyl reductase, partial [Burkholderiales bacterium]|nr:beta-ketoacyl reductase [Burkholderiales bacterium]